VITIAPTSTFGKITTGASIYLLGFFVGFLLSTGSVTAQQNSKIARIGILSDDSSHTGSSLIKAFHQGLRELGYEEGKNISFEYRYADGKKDKLQELAAELVTSKVDLIFARGAQPTQAAKRATITIPIVFPTAGDPVAFGFAESLARPGGNLTGLTNLSPELSGKRVQLLKEAVPQISRVAVLFDPGQPPQSLSETTKDSEALNLTAVSFEIRDSASVETAFGSITKQQIQALITLPQSMLTLQRHRILELAGKLRIPSMHQDKTWVEVGGLMSYGPDTFDLYRRAALYVDKILKGSKPASLPIERPKKFELVINLKTAKQIGLTIPPNVLARADRVIK
jgi:putative ABC transport system substrate-binding protein